MNKTKAIRMAAKLKDGFLIQIDYDLATTLPVVAGSCFRRAVNLKAKERMTAPDWSTLTSEPVTV